MEANIPSLFSLATRAAFGLNPPLQPDLFTYRRISQGYQRDELFGAAPFPGSFIQFAYIGDEPGFEWLNDEFGWKFHIAIDDRENANVIRAWNLVIKNIILRYRLFSKVIKPNVILYNHQSQCGKQVTIYHCATPTRNWSVLIRELERLLRICNIPIGHFSPADRRIPGSLYISYRNDKGRNGKYISASRLNPGDYNPSGYQDPLYNIDLRDLI